MLILVGLFCSVATAAFAQQPAVEPETHHLGAMSGKSMMESPLGAYGMNRDASGTSWQPDATAETMHHDMKGDWVVMKHADLDLVYDHQGGARGNDKTYLAGMFMIGGWRPVGRGALNLRAMVSPDALMGKDGYPLLLSRARRRTGSAIWSTDSIPTTCSWSCRPA
jgi:hypothetical protein